jgi:hypothetical protein
MAIQKSKSLTLFLSYQLKNWPIWPNFEVNGLDWQCCLAGCSKMALRIFIFSIVLGAKYLSYLKFIATVMPSHFLVYYFSLSQCVSQAEKEKTACKGEEIQKMTPIFTQNDSLYHFE